MLARRELMLRDFVLRARTETAGFIDDQRESLGNGIEVGPTVVTTDFLGDAIVRATVRNTTSRPLTVVLVAHLRASDGSVESAAAALTMAAGARTSVDVLCMRRIVPIAVMWTASIL